MHAEHEILVSGPDFEACENKVLRFFTKNMLVRYDTVRIAEEESINAKDPLFWQRLENGVAANRRTLDELGEELTGEGFKSMADCLEMGQGYHSKLFHTIAHLLDGFFGVDTVFYSLEEDSHGVSKVLRQRIEADPGGFRIVKVVAESSVGDADQVQKLRSFEGPTD
jgi:hypothetical protein